jgi:hypothetical protein
MNAARVIDPAQAPFWNALGGRPLEAADVEPYGVEFVSEPERLREVERIYPCPTAFDAGYGIFGAAVSLVCVDDATGRAVAYAPPVTVLRATLNRQAEVLRGLKESLEQIALLGDDPGADAPVARESMAHIAGQAVAVFHPPPDSRPPRNRPPGFERERRQRGLCPICGERIRLVGNTTDGRLIGSCMDAFTGRQWRQLGPRIAVKS